MVGTLHEPRRADLLERGLRPHLILIDLMLPRVSGFDVLHHIRTDHLLKTIPRIVITGAADRDDIVADAIFEKPFNQDELLAPIHRLVGTPEPQQADNVGFIHPSRPDTAHDAARPEGNQRR